MADTFIQKDVKIVNDNHSFLRYNDVLF